MLAKTAGALAAGLAGRTGIPAAHPVEELARSMRADGDTGGTLAGFLAALVLLGLVAGNGILAFIVAMVALLPAMLLMPVNYGAAVAFITCTVSMMYAVSGEEADFLRYRVADNLVGVAVVGGVGLLLWRTSRADWWRVARLTAGSLAAAIASPVPVAHRDELVTRALQLRTETVEAALREVTGRVRQRARITVPAALALTGAVLALLQAGKLRRPPSSRSDLRSGRRRGRHQQG